MAQIMTMIKIGGSWYPALPPNAYGKDGLHPRDKHWMYPPKKPPRVVHALNPNRKAPNLPFASPKFTPDPHSAGLPRMRPPTLPDFFKRGLPRALGPVGMAISMLPDPELEWMDPASVVLDKVTIEVSDPIVGADGKQYNVDVPPGWFQCSYTPGYAPGTQTNSANHRKQMHGTEGLGFNKRTNNTDNLNCGSWGSGIQWTAGVYPGRPGTPPFTGLYTRTFVPPTWTTLAPGSNPTPWITWQSIEQAPTRFPTYHGITTPGEWPSSEGLRPSIPPVPVPFAAIDPATRHPALPTEPFPPNVPFRYLPHLRNIPGIRERYSPSAGGPPVRPRTPTPTRPDNGDRERKKQWKGKPLLRALREGVFHPAGELCDAVGAVWDALPGNKKWVPGVPQGCAEQAQSILRNWKDIDWPQAVMNLAINHFTDKAIGRFLGMGEDAFKRATGGTPGWRIPTGFNM